MILSDRDLETLVKSGGIVIDPIGSNAIQPASIDLTLGKGFAHWPSFHGPSEIDLGEPLADQRCAKMTRVESSEFRLFPGSFALATTAERVKLCNRICARVEGRSSLGRIGLVVHATAGFIDPGWDGQITLELYNLSPHVLMLHEGMGICQLTIEQLSSSARRPYGSPGLGSKYQHQVGVAPSRWKPHGLG